MRIEITTEKRLGALRDVMLIFNERQWMVRGVEMEWHHIYVDVPRLEPDLLAEVVEKLHAIAGVKSVHEIDLLPGERRRAHFDVLLSALGEPVIAIGSGRRIVAANQAAMTLFGIDEAHIDERADTMDLFGVEADRQIMRLLTDGVDGEVCIQRRPFIVDMMPLHSTFEDVPDVPHGAVLVFRSPASLGQNIHSIAKREESSEIKLVGDSPSMQKVSAMIRRLAPIAAPLLITGETGTGKELVARSCHQNSPRKSKPFLALNCAALPENLAESELFGYAPGAFSGAQKSGKPGLFELADGGTVFLDEIGEMSLYLQAKLLRFLQDSTFIRIGGKVETRVNIRLIAATHRDLLSMIRKGTFREDLYYRLHVLTIKLPPLRERHEDIRQLAVHFANRAAQQIGKPFREISPACLDKLTKLPWPGNARQLENAMFRAVSLSEDEELNVHDIDELMEEFAEQAPEVAEVIPFLRAEASETHAQAMDRMEKVMLEDLYQKFPSTRKLAQRLSLSHTAVANKLKRYGIA
ncbi:sigma 54-interacting transcriptional regulator [Acidovorax sp.]|uniref:sigma 54-interacting transcriptional regulator n=1 Tax=Acidovorax sp. TaxID=1872122 RepID=UPI003BB09C80